MSSTCRGPKKMYNLHFLTKNRATAESTYISLPHTCVHRRPHNCRFRTKPNEREHLENITTGVGHAYKVTAIH